ncbi:hypothetical protein LK12_17865 [Novosphingobium malaysiense]|uniref:Acyl-protein synthetase LuxE domain-containing protein n=1 Tax=Novosphingobium malaysiense TaxID=1348853 RepID=A0A0B1ZLA0_9SPHN|nr:hypothetical protein LK12_17865 [Novosphingobium malaysiense]
MDARSFYENPQDMLHLPVSESLAMPSDDVEALQLHAVRKRFAELRDRLPPLAKLAAEHGIDEIADLNQAAALLFKHSVYKSYPLSLIEKGRFDRLTHWLGNLTTADLSGVEAKSIGSVDEWLDTLLEQANVRVVHTTGTSGKLSFLPRGPDDEPIQARSTLLPYLRIGEPEPTDLAQVPVIIVGHRTMFNAYGAGVDALAKHLYGDDESMLPVMDPGRLSADVLSLAGRLASAENRGELGRSQISQGILDRLDAFVEAQKSAPQRRAAFFEDLFESQRGKRVMMAGNWGMYLEMAEAGSRLGIDKVFSPESRFLCSGGTKGKTLPDDYRERILDFLGIEDMPEGYGMSEMTTLMPRCSARKYHALPWMLVFLLDPRTGEPAPRSGTHTGRFGVIDLAIQSRWGGILSGDEVTMTFGKCACGLDGPYIEGDIRRFSEAEGGDDKITCAGAPEAHDNALAFLADLD